MKAYVTSIGEKTTEICCQQLIRFGFEVILLDGKKPWVEKYKDFIELAGDDCLRIDADVIVNKNIIKAKESFYTLLSMGCLSAQCNVFDFYKNDVHTGQPVFYSKEAINIIRKHINSIDPKRPETSAWRLPFINPKTVNIDSFIVGMHGFFQDKDGIERAFKNKSGRGQLGDFDFGLVDDLINL